MNRTVNKYRNPIIDEVKGFAIIIVVIDHIIQYVYAPAEFDNNILFRIIYSFHMPLFFFISGYVSALTKKEITWDTIGKRFFSLYIPLVFWGTFDYVYRASDSEGGVLLLNGFKKMMLMPETGMWFLWVLAVCSLLSLLPEFICIGKYREVKFLLVFLMLKIPWISMPGLPLVRIYWAFYALGLCTDDIKSSVSKEGDNGFTTVFTAISMILYVICVAFWKRNTNPIFYDSLIIHFPSNTSRMLLDEVCKIYTFWLVPFLGIVFWITVWKAIYKKFGPFKWLAWIGQRTIEIYVMHWYFLGIIETHSALMNSLISFAISLVIPLVAGAIIRRLPYVRYVLLGDRSDFKKHIKF